MRGYKRGLVVGFELVLIVLSTFAFSYRISESESSFLELKKNYESLNGNSDSALVSLAKAIFASLKKPMVPLASAAEGTDAGCCYQTVEGSYCVTSSPENCEEGSLFAESALCSQTSFCKKGCCYDEDAGIYDRNVIEGLCEETWVADANCNLGGARLGCCILGTETVFETLGQCETDTEARALGESGVVDWRTNYSEFECALIAEYQSEGACVLSDGDCEFLTIGDCLSLDGEFNEGYLCTSQALETDCEPTEETTCVEGKDEVYFVDSCGNRANVYDYYQKDSEEYWEKVIEDSELCGADDEGGNAESAVCGNCNRILGGYCSDAEEDDFDVKLGENYCKETSCEFEGETYKNGESWCIYDGAIGNGDDVVGSRHWKYVCNQGTVDIEPCADYRNQICIQSDTKDYSGEETIFRNAECVANNWRNCIELNSADNGLEKCQSALNCELRSVYVSDEFNFDVCTPKYPGGFDLNNEKYLETAEEICGQASQTCVVMMKSEFAGGGCEYVANEECLSETFAQEMNDWCRSLGDCGMEANIVGEFNKNNYKVVESPKLGSSWLSKLSKLSKPVEGQYAETEDYSEYLGAAGLSSGVRTSDDPYELGDDIQDGIQYGAMGVAGIAYAGYAMGLFTTTATVTSTAVYSFTIPTIPYITTAPVTFSVPVTTTSTATVMAPFAGAAIGASIGAVAGLYLAKELDLDPLGTILMASGGAIAGGAIGYAALAQGTQVFSTVAWFGGAAPAGAVGVIPFFGLIILAGIIIMSVAAFMMAGDCDPIYVEFECKPWQAPSGGDNCEVCNDDPLKPCSEYRCESLGASCELLNEGTGEEVCVDSRPDDVIPPVVSPWFEVISNGQTYDDMTSTGFSVSMEDGSCLEAYTPFSFGVTTDEPAICRYDLTETVSFDDMSYDLGLGYYAYNHTTVLSLPNPSHGESQGGNWNGELTLYIKCEDSKGHVTPSYYTIDLCVNEGPDFTAPMILATDPATESYISYDENYSEIVIATNELSTCRWDDEDGDYSLLENEMTCEDSLGSPSLPLGYKCSGDFYLNSTENTYYIKCMDQPWLVGTDNESSRNSNSESFEFVLKKPEEKISIESILPNSTIEIGTDYTTIELEVVTSGGANYHFCSYSFSGYDNMIEFYETGTERTHVQDFSLAPGERTVYVNCTDYETGDVASGYTEFEVIKDETEPVVARIWQEGDVMKFMTTESSECRYSNKYCRFEWDNATDAGTGTYHTFDVTKGETYFVKCEDEFGNIPADCSIEAQAL